MKWEWKCGALIMLLMTAPFRGLLADDSTVQKCGFPQLLQSWFSADQFTRQKGKPVHANVNETWQTPSGKFIIHYELTGEHGIPAYDRNSNGTPDYLEFVGTAFDRAWEIEIDSLGFAPPPDAAGQPVEQYDIYLEDIGQGLYGRTEFGDSIPEQPGVYRFPSTITLNIAYDFVNYPNAGDSMIRDSMAIAVTAAHEFNHACQLGYRLWYEAQGGGPDDLWFIEASATHMEEVVCDEVNDYYFYLNGFFQQTDRYIGESFGSRIYGQSIFPLMLDEVYGGYVVREIWEEIREMPVMASIDRVCQQRGSSLDEEYHRLALWMYFCGINAIEGDFFSEAADYPSPAVTTTSSLDERGQVSFNGLLPSMAFEYLRTPIEPNSEVSLLLTAYEEEESWSVDRFDSVLPFTSPVLEGAGTATFFTPFNLSQTDYLVFRNSQTMQDPSQAISYQVIMDRISSGAFESVRVGPNIIYPDRGVQLVYFIGVPEDARVTIHNSNGITLRELPSSGFRVTWDLLNMHGDPLGSGVYLYRIHSDNLDQRGKIVIVQ